MTAIEALAQAIVRAFDRPGRGYEGSKALCPDDATLKRWLAEDGVTFTDKDLTEALELLETGRVPGIGERLVRGNELHLRFAPGNASAIPHRAMLIEYPLVRGEFKRSDPSPYLV
jgi:hypothetical protein